jgi:hypothetical protein
VKDKKVTHKRGISPDRTVLCPQSKLSFLHTYSKTNLTYDLDGIVVRRVQLRNITEVTLVFARMGQCLFSLPLTN